MRNIRINLLVFVSVVGLLGARCTALAGGCQGCMSDSAMKVTPDWLEKVKKESERNKSRMRDTASDNPDDSTTNRTDTFDDVFPRTAIGPKRKAIEKSNMPTLIDLAKNDPYPQIRIKALERLQEFYIKPKNEIYSILTEALSDPHFYVRNYAATIIVLNCTYDSIIPNPEALKMVKDLALGIGRPGWNVRGLYSKHEIEKNNGVVDKKRDELQTRALVSLDKYFENTTGGKRNIYFFLDSISQFCDSEVTRSLVKQSQHLLGY